MRRAKNKFPRRGEAWWVNFASSVGSEIKKTRPAVVMSNDVSNEFLERVQVVPFTSNTEKIYPSESLVSLKGRKSKAAADQIATVSKKRLHKRIAMISADELAGVEYVIKMQLGL